MFGRKRRQARLEPVRWRRPGRAGLVRLGVIALLLTTAAAMGNAKQPPSSCPPPAPTPPAATAADAEANPETAVPSGAVGVPVRLAEPAALTMVEPGDRVDLLAVNAEAATHTVASAALVLRVGPVDDPAPGALYVALSPAEARRVVSVPADTRFAVLVRPAR